jgi:hypothetical protein
VICGVQSGPRKIASTYNPTQHDKSPTTPNTIARSEIDNHADTTCFGSNFTAISFTGEHCEVSPFSEQYNTLTNIPVATAATAWDNPNTGERTILLFHQGLWFGNSLTNSLINLNQCRMHGIDLCDDPFDPHRTIGMWDPTTEINIPMDFAQSFVYLTTRAPTMDEIRTLPSIEMTSDAPWIPSKLGQAQLSWEEEERRAIIGNVTIDEYTISCTRPDEPQLRLDEAEYDILMASCSAVYSERTLLQRLVSSVQIATCYEEEANEGENVRKMAAVDTRARHTALSVEDISKKFGIGLETARQTLKATTQFGIRHAIHPLSRRYRTDIMQSKRQ